MKSGSDVEEAAHDENERTSGGESRESGVGVVRCLRLRNIFRPLSFPCCSVGRPLVSCKIYKSALYPTYQIEMSWISEAKTDHISNSSLLLSLASICRIGTQSDVRLCELWSYTHFLRL